MTGGAGGRFEVIDSHHPGIGIEIHFVFIGVKSVAVLGFIIDFFLRMIGTEVTFGAGFRLTSLSLGERVPSMAGVTGPSGTIRIQTPDPGIGPVFHR